MSAKVIGDLVVKIGGDTKGLVDAATRVDGTLKSMERTAQAASKAIAGAVAGAAIALIALTRQSQNQIDAQVKLAERMNSSVGAVQTLTYAADLAGINLEKMTSAADMLNRKIGEATRDSISPANDAIRRLGLSAAELAKMGADQRFATIADRIQQMGFNGSQTADILRQLGIRGGEFATLMMKGGDEIRKAAKDLEDFGVKLNDVDAKKVEIANDAMTTLGYVVKGVGNQMAVALAPAIQAVSEYLSDASRNSGGFKSAIQTAVDISVRAFGMVRREIYLTRVGFDEMIGDFLDGWDAAAGAIPKFLSKVTGLTPQQLGFEPINKSWGKLRQNLEAPPSSEEWDKWWENYKKKANEAAQVAVDAARNAGKNAPQGEYLSAQERKQLEEKFQRLQQAIAKEDEALKLQQQKQLKDLEEFYKKGVITKQQYDTTKLQIEEAHQDKMRALILSKLEEGILTEQELLTRKHALQMQAITDFENNKTITAQQANELRLAHAREHALQMAQITARQYSQLAGIVDTSLGAISGIITDQNSKAFKAMKVISTATALVKGYEAMVSAYAAGARIGGPALGSVFAGIAAAGTAAIIAKIHGVGQSSTGTVSAPASAQVPATAEANNSQTLYIKGLDRNAIFSGSQVRQLAEELLEYQANGGKVVRFAQ